MSEEEYEELGRDLLDKMREFIQASEPGEPLIPLHKAYAAVKGALDAADPDSEVNRRRRSLEEISRQLEDLRRQKRKADEKKKANHDRWQAEHDAFFARRNAWMGLSATEREHQILNVLDGEQLGANEITERINGQRDDWQLYVRDLKGLLPKMVGRGELQRVKEPRTPASRQFRWLHYRETRTLSPELEAMERALKGEEA